MATAESTVREASSHSLFGGLWQRWLRKRQRDRVRSLSRVRFRLTREGVHYLGILLFIFLGAILRDTNLLILLAGAMIGLLLLQWRFSGRTLLGLTAALQLPRTTKVGQETELTIRMNNPKRWLGAWLVMVEDPIQKLLPESLRLSDKGVTVLDEVPARGTSSAHYQLTFHQRGRFRIGPSTISTRFPLGLGRGSKTLDNAQELIVHPKLGKLTARAAQLYQQERQGNAQVAPTAGMHEAEFYGLRPWATGDSRRWIHWRTTARLGELSVRQFERKQRRQICVLLDLYCPRTTPAPEVSEHCETAISFVATLATATAMQGSDRLAVAVAGQDCFALPNVQSSVLVENLLERLAVIAPSHNAQLWTTLQGISIPLLANRSLLVVSTRASRTDELRRQSEASGSKMMSRMHVRWLDVSRNDLEAYFLWP
ncbi:MAG: DUF58 domain-containing protein [Planctomycetales bacterium]|nr:DUF58 domain-containing protein [Planctomycetales bacterium]